MMRGSSCQCKNCLEEREIILREIFPNADTNEELEEAVKKEAFKRHDGLVGYRIFNRAIKFT